MEQHSEQADRAGGIEAYRSLARHAGVPLEEVLTAAVAGDLRGLVTKGIERRAVLGKFRAQIERRQCRDEHFRSRLALADLRRERAALRGRRAARG